LAWLTTKDPAPIERTQSALSHSEITERSASNGATIDAVVINATVEDPWAVFIAAHKIKGKRSPQLFPIRYPLTSSAIPLFCNTVPKFPPAPVISNIEAASRREEPTHPFDENIFFAFFAGSIKAKNIPTIKAITGVPKKSINLNNQEE
jgi:hypothetical protein